MEGQIVKRLNALGVALALSLTPISFSQASAAPIESNDVITEVTGLRDTTSERKKAPTVIAAKRCNFLCSEGTLPKAEVGAFFGHLNTEIVLVNRTSIQILNLDKRKITDTSSYDWESNPIQQASISPDQSSLYLYSIENGVFRMNLDTLAVTDVSPLGSYPVSDNTDYTIAASTAGDGYYAVVRVNNAGESWLCHYGESGQELACSEAVFTFSGGVCGLSVWPLEAAVYLVKCDGSVNPVLVYSATDLTRTRAAVPLTDVNQLTTSYLRPDGHIVVVGQYTSGAKQGKFVVTKIDPVALTADATVDLPDGYFPRTVVGSANDNLAFVVAGKSKGSKVQSKVFVVDFDLEMVTETVKLPGLTSNYPAWATIDYYSRYALVGGYGWRTPVVALRSDSDEIYVNNVSQCVSWTTSWDYLNLNLQTDLKEYHVRYNSADALSFVYDHKVAPGVTRSYTITEAEPGWVGDIYTIQKGGKWGVTSNPYSFVTRMKAAPRSC